MGYAFIGFTSPEETRRFAGAMNGYQFPGTTNGKVLQVVPAKYQGSDPRQGSKRNRRRKKKEAGDKVESEDPDGSERGESPPGGAPPPRPQGNNQGQKRRRLDAPLTRAELASLDANGNSRPIWLLD